MEFAYGEPRCTQDSCHRKKQCARFLDILNGESSGHEVTPYIHPDPATCGAFVPK
jgi:hypothetical protein